MVAPQAKKGVAKAMKVVAPPGQEGDESGGSPCQEDQGQGVTGEGSSQVQDLLLLDMQLWFVSKKH